MLPVIASNPVMLNSFVRSGEAAELLWAVFPMDNPPLLQRSSNLFVPPALASLNIQPDDCQLVASYNRSLDRTRFTYSVSWSNKASITGPVLQSTTSDDRLLLSIREPIDESSQAIYDVQSLFKPKKQDTVLCDGPCGRRYPPESMLLLGRCGHYLCKTCSGLVYNEDGTKGCSNFYCVYASLYAYLPEEYARRAYESHIVNRQRAIDKARRRKAAHKEEEPHGESESHQEEPRARSARRSLIPRSPRRAASKKRSNTSIGRSAGPPPVTCVPISRDVRPTTSTKDTTPHSPTDRSDRKLRLLDEIFSDMSMASSNQEGPTSEFELLNVRLMVFEPGPFKTIKRVHISREMSAALTLKEAIDELMDKRNGNIRHECPSQLYFCSENTGDGLRKVGVEEFETAHLWQYPARNSVLHFVLDAVGYLRGKGAD